VDTDEFQPNGSDIRTRYQIPSDTLLIAVIGKLSKERGFELALETFARIQKRMANTRLMIIGHGEHRAALESFARDLDITPSVIWAGYHENDLADHYRASDFLLFTAKGSDEGHRAVIEAMACGTVPITAPLPGMDAMVGELPLVAGDTSADALANLLLSSVADLDTLRTRVVDRAGEFAFPRAAQRLLTAYSQVL
jgi:glycosyltransferase involved in cell wall biosynthesis